MVAGVAYDRPGKAPGGEPRQQARMVDVRVRHDDEIEGADVEVERRRVLLVGVAAALEHPAVDEEARVRRRRPGSTIR